MNIRDYKRREAFEAQQKRQQTTAKSTQPHPLANRVVSEWIRSLPEGQRRGARGRLFQAIREIRRGRAMPLAEAVTAAKRNLSTTPTTAPKVPAARPVVAPAPLPQNFPPPTAAEIQECFTETYGAQNWTALVRQHGEAKAQELAWKRIEADSEQIAAEWNREAEGKALSGIDRVEHAFKQQSKNTQKQN